MSIVLFSDTPLDEPQYALAFYGGEPFHAVTRTGEETGQPGDLAAYIYRSAPNGECMTLAASVDLSYDRLGWSDPDEYNWMPWTDAYPEYPQSIYYQMPQIADIAFKSGEGPHFPRQSARFLRRSMDGSAA